MLPFDFFVPNFSGYYTNITVNSYNTNFKRIISLEKSLIEKYVHIPGCQKHGAFHIGTRKIGPFIYFLLKKGGQSYTWQCRKRGLFGTHIRTMPYIGSYPPPPLSHPTHTPRYVFFSFYNLRVNNLLHFLSFFSHCFYVYIIWW